MKIEIDLNDILTDEHGEGIESLRDSIRRQVIDRLAEDARKETQKLAANAINSAIAVSVQSAINDRIPSLIEDLLDTEYTPVGQYGERANPTTVRKQLVKHLTETAHYKHASFSSDKNPWTVAVDAAVSKTLGEFQKSWAKEVDNKFMAQAMNYAAEAFAKRAGIALKPA